MPDMPIRKNADKSAAKYHRMTPADDGFIDKQVINKVNNKHAFIYLYHFII